MRYITKSELTRRSTSELLILRRTFEQAALGTAPNTQDRQALLATVAQITAVLRGRRP